MSNDIQNNFAAGGVRIGATAPTEVKSHPGLIKTSAISGVPLIKMRDIGKIYRTGSLNYEALKHVDLDINYGEYLIILGPSGSGKSTFMQILGCLSTPTSGSYMLAGKEVSSLTRNELAYVRNREIGFIFQSFNLLPQFTILENVALPLIYRGVRFEERTQRAASMLEKLGLATHLEHRANELSGGQQQRVAIARALVTEPDMILADEPTGNLDSKAGVEVMELLKEFSQSGKTVVVITHDSGLTRYASRTVHIRDGMLTQD